MNFSEQDQLQINKKGITEAQILEQLTVFKTGLPYINLNAAATLKDGIASVSKKEATLLIESFEAKRNVLELVKFVPASGAATRMFKFLFSFLETYNAKKGTLNAYINKYKANQLAVFLVGFEKLPFYNQVIIKITSSHKSYDNLSVNDKVILFIETMLDEDLLNLSAFPKGIIPFHNYKDHVATAFEEHLFEAALYASSKSEANLHFTISKKHKNQFDSKFKDIQTVVEEKTRTKFKISFSFQEEKTDTIAVDSKLKAFRDDSNDLHFRPSGHGALLQNLNTLDADIIFIKNIDNVVVYKYQKDIANSKKVLAGLLLEKQEKTFQYLELIENGLVTKETIIEIKKFLENELNSNVSTQFNKFSKDSKIETLVEKLNRPIRVCGMVKNEGEPGGGPFWVNENDGTKSLQIVESAQINLSNPTQEKIINKSTHFNPVDIVCSIKDYKGKRFNLEDFKDEKTAFITEKTHLGKTIKALELPGLWNGSMAKWNTIFVEVPLITFNPVKTVNDLLKPAHQV